MFIVSSQKFLDENFDVVIFINDEIKELKENLGPIEEALRAYEMVNPKISDMIDIVSFPTHPCQRMIYSPTGKLDGDADDRRNRYDAANVSVKKAISMECKKPLLFVGSIKSAPTDAPWIENGYPLLNVALGALHELYTPLEVLEAFPEKPAKYATLGIFGATEEPIKVASAIEEGRSLARDIGGSDPKRMCASKLVEYLEKVFKPLSNVKFAVTDIDPKEYPFVAAVNRATSGKFNLECLKK